MRMIGRAALAILLLGIPTLGFAGGAHAAAFPMDTPMKMRDIEAVCTGVGAEARSDPRWAGYRLRVEVAGTGGEYLGDVQVSIAKGGEALASVACGGPWVLFNLAPGAYDVTAEFGGESRMGKANVGAAGQARIVLRFTNPAR